MAGQAVPIVLIPRYTSFVGMNEFTTVPIEVSDYEMAHITFWRGRCPDSFEAVFEESHDTFVWSSALGTPITSVDTSDRLDIQLSKRWFRVRITLSTSPITCWASGLLERRLEVKEAK